MKKHRVATTDLEITDICFGAAPLGAMPDTYGYTVDEETAYATVRAIFDGPVNFLDTSRVYGFGRSEERIGAVIRERGGLPKGFVLATKLDRDIETGRFDASQVRRSLEQSLKALNLDSVPMLHLHDPEYASDLNDVTGKGGALDELFRMKEEGLTKAVGLAMGRLDIMVPIVRDRDFDVVLSHNRFTLLNRSANELFDLARAKGMTVLNAAPYAGGVLAKGSARFTKITYQEAGEEKLAPVRRIEAIAAAHGVAPGAVALQFSVNDPRIASTVIGVSKAARVAETLEWAAAPIPDAVWAELAALPFETRDPEADREYVPG